ncbi:mechanosensitive ion channel family protein [Halotalea alkalilenta]|uniref:Small-conductance mechanosensitive channel n=1 Tax=Halotalea alkalilenta TaxID=376489 RepID=A0A172YJR0_9GAMM|nr:mechanosensitive ion channel domain-containing protein [Halotalea alkalilenta]ANF59449.1 mechanosensitive ion channel protein MscS [Halotalea alkalilenta]
MEEGVNQLWSQMGAWMPLMLSYAGNLVLALITLAIGWWIISLFTASLTRLMKARHIEPTLQSFVLSVLGLLLKALLLISVASMVGIATTSFVAIIGAAGLAVGLALQGSLSNFAGGVLILLFRPFKVGDYIVSGGIEGTVTSIEMFRTILRTGDNKVIYVPNSNLSNNVVTNTSQESTRRGSVSLLIDYEDDPEEARRLLLAMIEGDEKIHATPAPAVSYVPNAGNIAVTLYFWSSTGDNGGLVSRYSEEAIKVLKQAGFRLGVNSRAGS